MTRRLVLDEAMPLTTLERVSVPEEAPQRVAYFASWGADATVSRSLAAFVTELEKAGYHVVLSRASDDDAPLVWPEGHTSTCTVIRRPNIGYDFGSWATAMAMFPQYLTAPHVLVVNDSLIGPFDSLAPMIADFEGSFGDVWGATNTEQGGPHMQSYILGFHRGVLADDVLRTFWQGIEILPDKEDIIHRYEIGLSRLLFEEGYVSVPWWENVLLAQPDQNPSVSGWRKLLQLGFPFVKRQLLTVEGIVPDADDVPDAIRARFGEDVFAWA